MPKLRNINPLGYVDVPLIGRQGPAPYLVCHTPDIDGNCPQPFDHEHTQVVGKEFGEPGSGCLVPGEEFDVSDEHAALLLEQAGNYELVEESAKKSTTKPQEG